MSNLNSKAKLIKDIPWNTTIVVEKIMFDPNLFEIHKERINKIFEKATPEQKEMQLQNIMIRDTIFNQAMAIVSNCFEFELDQREVDNLIEPLKKSVAKLPGMTDEIYNEKINDIANKLIQKQLMFDIIAEKENINVTDEETKKVLDDYYAATNFPVGDVMRDPTKLESARRTLLEEKITVHIIEKFPRDMSKLYENMQKDIEAQKKAQLDAEKQNKQ